MFGVGFDFDHTLGLDHRLERVALLSVLSRVQPDARADEPAWGALIDVALGRYRHGGCTLETAINDVCKHVLGATYVLGELYTQFVDEVMALAPSYVTPIPGSRELLIRLRAAGVPTAILTNGWNPLQQKKADILGYPGRVIVSDDIGVRKPAKAAFDQLAAALELPPERILYVGDSAEADMAGALNAGMQAVWFNWERQEYPANLPPPTATIDALEKVDELVFLIAP